VFLPDFRHEEEQGISPVTFCEPVFSDLEQFIRIKARLCGLIDSGIERLILDLSSITCSSPGFVV
jgi:hypothetical protein